MTDKKPNSPQTVAVLGVGTAAAIGIAIWSISGALAPRHSPSARPPVLAAPAATGGASADAVIPSAAPEGGVDGISRAAPPPAAPSTGESLSRSSVMSEAMLALNVDPFTPIKSRTAAPESASTGAAPGSTGGRTAAAGPGITAGPNAKPVPGGSAPNNKAPAQPAPVPAPPVPELVGTLLGERPSALFQGSTELVAVPVGGMFGAWKVLSVHHGEAVVKAFGKTMRLQAGAPPAADEPAAPGGSQRSTP